MNYTEEDILRELDLRFSLSSMSYHTSYRKTDAIYPKFFLDLEDGYCVVAGSYIHLYADEHQWAIVFEKNGYGNRRTAAVADLYYFGNCISQKHSEGYFDSNISTIDLIDSTEFARIENTEGSDLECFELISLKIKQIKIRDQFIPFEQDTQQYQKLGIEIRNYSNSQQLIGFEDWIRYVHETQPSLLKATEEEIRQRIPQTLPKIMTIGHFHFTSWLDDIPPSTEETYRLIAKVLVTQNTDYWQPTLPPNNHWSNWASGEL